MNNPHSPAEYGAAPQFGNYTDDAEVHLWCAQALAIVVTSEDATFPSFNDDVQKAVRYLLRAEIGRAAKAQEACAMPPENATGSEASAA